MDFGKKLKMINEQAITEEQTLDYETCNETIDSIVKRMISSTEENAKKGFTEGRKYFPSDKTFLGSFIGSVFGSIEIKTGEKFAHGEAKWVTINGYRSMKKVNAQYIESEVIKKLTEMGYRGVELRQHGDCYDSPNNRYYYFSGSYPVK